MNAAISQDVSGPVASRKSPLFRVGVTPDDFLVVFAAENLWKMPESS